MASIFRELKNKDLRYITFLYVGVNFNATDTKGVLKHPVWFVIILGSSLIWISGMFANIWIHFDNPDIVAENLTNLVPCIYAILKFFSLLPFVKDIAKYLKDVENLLRQLSHDEYEIWSQQNQCQQLIVAILYISIIICAVCFNIVTPIYFFKGLIIDGKPQYKLTNKAIFPVDHMSNPFYFLCSYIALILLSAFVTHSTVGVDSLFSSGIFNISAQFRILKLKFKMLAKAEKDYNTQKFLTNFNSIIYFHNKVIELCYLFNKIFAMIVYFQVGGSCLYMCFLLFRFNTNENMSNLVIIQLVILTLQTAIYCLCGEKIRSESDEVYDALLTYFPWDRFNRKTQLLFMLPIQRCQCPITLKGVFFIVDGNLLIWILKTAFSYSAIMKAVNES